MPAGLVRDCMDTHTSYGPDENTDDPEWRAIYEEALQGVAFRHFDYSRRWFPLREV